MLPPGLNSKLLKSILTTEVDGFSGLTLEDQREGVGEKADPETDQTKAQTADD